MVREMLVTLSAQCDSQMQNSSLLSLENQSSSQLVMRIYG